MAEPLQRRKTLLLRGGPTKGNQRKHFSRRTLVGNPTDVEYDAYQHLQKVFSKSSFLIHFNPERPFLIDVNAFKHEVKRSEIQSVMFLSKQLSEAEIRYWSTELEVAGVVWIVRKLRHLIESCKKSPTLVFTDHSATVGLVKQTSLITFNTDKLNLRLVRASQFLSTLSIHIRVKPERFHVVPDALSRLKSTASSDNKSSVLEDLNDVDSAFAMTIGTRKTPFWDTHFHRIHEILDIHFGEGLSLIEMDGDFAAVLEEVYRTDDQWFKIRAKLKTRVNGADTSDGIKFIFKDNHVYYALGGVIPRLCIPWALEKKVYVLAHDDNHHCGFHRAYVRVSGFLYIRHLSKRLRRYIKYCKTCLKDQTTRHASYEELNPIKILALSFHIITIDFILSLPETPDGMNSVFTTTDKFSKRISLTPNKTT